MKTLFLLSTLAALVLTGCMTDKEAWLRNRDMDIKAAYKETYKPLVIKGGMTLSDDAELVVTVPSQPYQHTPIPDGAAAQERIIGNITQAAGLVGLGAVGIYKAGDKTSNTTSKATQAETGGN